MASTSALERIALAIQTSLGTITGVSEVIRPVRAVEAESLKDAAIILTQGAETIDDERPVGIDQWERMFLIAVVLRTSDKSTTPLATRQNDFDAKIKHLVASDPRFGLDSLVVDSEIIGSDPIDLDALDFDGVVLVMRVKYRHDEGDPYERSISSRQ